ncbi:MAG: tRNA (N6-isopentenyl adenosine(37)-C2)-methylthiotransferase MiaB [Bilifractor porci]|jgi:tRNA-2-methylthio-N6-dimethylallyladenosine synthase
MLNSEIRENKNPGAVPETEPERQYYFIRECRNIVKRKEEELGRPLTACCVTFGCQMNARDSEKLRGILEEIGYRNTDKEEADLVLYNTCTVRENANTKVYGRLGYLHSLKDKNPHMIIGLCGCMMQEQQVVDRLRKSFRFVDLIFGTHNVYKLAELLYHVFEDQGMVVDILQKTEQVVEELPTDRKYFFKSGVNIMYGCNNFCSYCIVPYVRGREHSRDPEEILCEIRGLVRDGVREVMLLGQNVNSYGKGLPEDKSCSFARLLEQIAQIEGLDRVRFMTSHPKDLSDDLIAVMAKYPNICRHLHLPLQSGSTEILKKMNRRYTKDSYLALVDRIREAMPDISLTTDIIVGFPGETEEDFQETMDVVRRVRFDSAFTFLYSRRSGTPAADMEQVPENVMKDRFDRLLALVQKTGREQTARFEGRTMDVLVEQVNEHDTSLVTGRLDNNTVVHFPGTADLIGQIVPVHLDVCQGFYYMGTRV